MDDEDLQKLIDEMFPPDPEGVSGPPPGPSLDPTDPIYDDRQPEPTQGQVGIGQPGLEDNIDVGGGANPGLGFSPGSPSWLDQMFAALGKGAGGAGGTASDFLKALLTGKGGLGGLELKDILGAGAGLFGTLNQNKNTKEAVKLYQDAAKDAQNQGRAITEGITAKYQPYLDTGRQATLDIADSIGKRGLADRFATPVAMPSANTFKQIPSWVGGVDLADLAKYRR